MFLTQDLQRFSPKNTADYFLRVKIFGIPYKLNVSKYLGYSQD